MLTCIDELENSTVHQQRNIVTYIHKNTCTGKDGMSRQCRQMSTLNKIKMLLSNYNDKLSLNN